MDIVQNARPSADWHAVTALTASMLPSIAALLRWPLLNSSILDGLLQANSELLGLDPSPRALRDLERALLDLAFPHRIELTKGSWLDELPDFVRRSHMGGLCALHLLPFDDAEADVCRMVFRYLVCVTSQTDAAMFRLWFG